MGAGRGAPSEASFAQERLWFIERLAPNSSVFNILNGFRINGNVNHEAMGEGVREIARRHEVLRTNFVYSAGKLMQHVGQVPPQVFEFIDVSDPGGGGLARAEAMALELAGKPMDLERDPLFRAILFKTGAEEHLLALLAHHAVFDGWSLRVLAKELVASYSAVAAGRAPALPAPGVHYSEYSERQRRRFNSGELDKDLAYWIGRIGNEPPMLELPFDRPRGAHQSYRGETFSTALSRELMEGLRGLGIRNGCTLYMTLLSAFYALLYRYTGNGDIVVGCPVAGRRTTELEGAIGFFVNTLPLRVDLSDDPPFAELLKRVRSAALEAYQHQELPFEKIVERTRPQRDLSFSPIYQCMFQLRNFPEPLPSSPQIRLERHGFGWATAQVDLFMDVSEIEDGMRCDIIFPPALFDRATVERMAGHFRGILEGAVADPDLRISMLPMMSEMEKRRLVVELNETETEYPRDRCVHQIFEDVAMLHPEGVAVTHNGVSVPYLELNQRANRLANFLLEAGLSKGEPVGVCLERSVETATAYLAILKAGGVYVPLSPSDPPQRLALIIGETRGRIVVTVSAHEHKLPAGVMRICLDLEARAIGTRGEENLPCRSGPTDAAYVIYTSGSTGIPKGVCCRHRGIVRLVVNTNYVRFAVGDTVVNSSNPTFDPTTFEVWGALLNGARLLVVDREVLLSSGEFERLIRRERADVVFMTTTLFHLKARHSPGTFATLRDVFVGGEALDPSTARKVLSASPPKRLINFYGPTENTGFSTYYEVREVPEGATNVPIGRNISNSRSYILDRNLQPVPFGVVGEIYVSGDGVAIGYFNNPGLTASAFMPNPFHGGVMYKTGDLGRYRAGGVIEYLGRSDMQVKIRGFRVEIGEVEAVIASHPAVALSAAVASEPHGRERRLDAYIVLNTGASLSNGELKNFMKERLPDYMIPSSFNFLDTMPLNANGKIERSSLAGRAEAKVGEAPSRQATDGTEDRLASLWSRVLGRSIVGLEDDFFELGGHSLSAIRLVSLIEEELKVALPVAALFRSPTLGGLARELRNRLDAGYKHIVPLREGGSRPILFLVHAGGGEVFNYRRLVEALGEDQPVYGLRAAGLKGEVPLPETIEEAASSYLEEVMRLQPEEPYHIAGWCIGAAIAYEMARQLRSAGKEAGFLGILNYEAPGGERWSSRRVARGVLMREAAFLAVDLLRYGRRRHLAKSLEIPRRAVGLVRLWMRASGMLPPDEVMLPGENIVLPEPWKRAILNLVKIVRHYEPQPYDRLITIFRQEPIPIISPTDPHYGWGRLASGGIIAFTSKGRQHGDLVEPPEAETTAKRIRDRMDWHEAMSRQKGK